MGRVAKRPPTFSSSILFSQASSFWAARAIALEIPYLSGSGSTPNAMRIFSFWDSLSLYY